MEQRGASRQPHLVFDGDERKYELWETKMLGHLHLLGLRNTVLREPESEGEIAADEQKNDEAYAEMIQLLDHKSLSLIMRDAPNDGRKALKVLREYYAGKGKPPVVNLYLTLSSLLKACNESIMDYIIKAEVTITALRNAGQTLEDDMLVAMVLKGLPERYKPFSVLITNLDYKITFADFKARLRSFEETEMRVAVPSDSVMKIQGGVGQQPQDKPKISPPERCQGDTETGLMVDTGATSHINDVTKFRGFDSTFRPGKHSVELGDGTRCSGIAQKRGAAEALLVDKCRPRSMVVQENLLSPSPTCLHPLGPDSPQNFAEILPTEMSVHIFGMLDAVSLCSASQTCRLWHRIIEENEQLWRRQCQLVRAVCQREVDGDRRDGLSWKLTLVRNYSRSRLKTAWQRGDFSHITSAEQLIGRTMVPLGVETWGEILQTELNR